MLFNPDRTSFRDAPESMIQSAIAKPRWASDRKRQMEWRVGNGGRGRPEEHRHSHPGLGAGGASIEFGSRSTMTPALKTFAKRVSPSSHLVGLISDTHGLISA